MRKFVLSAVAMAFTVGLALAVPAAVVKLDGDKLTVKEGKKGEEVEKTYKLGDKVKYSVGDKEYDAEKGKARIQKMADAGKGKVDITVEGEEITAVKFAAPKPKN